MASSRPANPPKMFEVDIRWDGTWYTENQNGGTEDQALEWMESILRANPDISPDDIRVVRCKRDVMSSTKSKMARMIKRVRGV